MVNKATAMTYEEYTSSTAGRISSYLQFIPCLDPLGSEKGKEEYSLLPEEYGRFLLINCSICVMMITAMDT